MKSGEQKPKEKGYTMLSVDPKAVKSLHRRRLLLKKAIRILEEYASSSGSARSDARGVDDTPGEPFAGSRLLTD